MNTSNTFRASKLIFQSCSALGCKNPEIPLTATNILLAHEFNANQSILSPETLWSVAMACVLLSSKSHEWFEIPAPMEQHVDDEFLDDPPMRVFQATILTFERLYWRHQQKQKQKHSQLVSEQPKKSRWDSSSSVTLVPPLLSPPPPSFAYSERYQKWKRVLLETESVVLSSIGFTTYPLHKTPHALLFYYLQALLEEGELRKQVAEKAWKYCDCATRGGSVVRQFRLEVVATAAIHLALEDLGLAFQRKEWWRLFLQTNESLSTIQNAMNEIIATKSQIDLIDNGDVDVDVAEGEGHEGDNPFVSINSSSWLNT